ncbi:MAG TPA: molybdopterin-dependent oxidoreductase [Anaerolineae bacterium]|nr:molybdopterin-dependent oxidoreductase [Anaerolineae bacterium]
MNEENKDTREDTQPDGNGLSEERRKFIKAMGLFGLTLGTASIAGGMTDLAEANTFPPMQGKLDFDETVYTTCDICMIRCPMKVYKKGDKAVFLEGNPADPFNKGSLCPKGKAALGFLNNPDRLLYPMKRTNPEEKGFGVNPGWVRISWEEAYDTIVNKILEATDNGKHGERFALFSHGAYGWCKRLLSSLGSPNIVTHYDTCFSPFFVGRKALIGGNLWTNLEGVKYMLSFGWDQPDRSKNQPTQQAMKAISNGAKVTCFNPFQGGLGSKTADWIPIKPGTDPAVALAMINYIISKNRFDKNFVKSKTNFYDHEKEIRKHFAKYTPEWAEKISEVPASTIVRIAKDFSNPKNWPALVPNHKRDGAGGPNYTNSYQMAHAIIILNTLVGAIDRDGGKATMAFGWAPSGKLEFVQDPPKGVKGLIKEKGSIDGKHKFPLVRDLITDRGIFCNVAQRILDKDPYELKMAIFRRYGILSFPNPKKIAKALSTLDFVVFMDSMPKEIMWFADLVLPEKMFLESDFISYKKVPTPGYKLVFAGNKAQKPAGEQKGWTGVLLELAKRLDKKLGTEYFKLKNGEWVTSKADNEAMLKSIDMTFSDLLKAPNGMWKKEAPYKSKSEYKTPSGKIEIYGNLFKQHGYDPLPSWLEKAAKPDSNYPFYMLLRRLPGLKHSSPITSDNPYSLDAFPEHYASINTSSAKKLGINEGDMVEVKSKQGAIKLKARLTERIRPDCVMVLHNYGHTVPQLTFNKGPSDGYLIPDRSENDPLCKKDWSAGAWMSDVCVGIRKV